MSDKELQGIPEQEVEPTSLERLRESLDTIGVDIERDIVGQSVLDIFGGFRKTFPSEFLGRDNDGTPKNTLGAALISEFDARRGSLDEGFPFVDAKFDLVTIIDGSYNLLYEEDIVDLFRVIKVGGTLRVVLDPGEAPGGGWPEDHFRYNLDRDGVNALVEGFRQDPEKKPYLIATKTEKRTIRED